MNRTTNTLVNFVTNFLLGYAILSRLRDRRAGVKAGLVLGTVGALVTFVFYDRFEAMGDDATETKTDIEVPAEVSAD